MKCMLLAAGLGTRLLPLTEVWPKCLMPVNGRPLLEYWLGILRLEGIRDVLVNKHHHVDIVDSFLGRPKLKNWVKSVYEPKLLGTAGTLRANMNFFENDTVLVAHADNWCCCNFSDFISYHENRRPEETLITMMTFESSHPECCGIVEVDEQGIVVNFHEKIKNPPGQLANAAIYIIEPEVMSWISKNESVSDFSTDVIPHFMNKIATWKNNGIHKDIGTIEMLQKAQFDTCKLPPWDDNDFWQDKFLYNPIHTLIEKS